jgi:2-amino-4-hydroxy-6-hydroxymethyldihydropteridine diphosphokinase
MRERTTPDVYLYVGSNINPEQNLQKAIDLLKERTEVLAISSVYQTPPFGFMDQPDFLDIVVKLTTPVLAAAFKMDVIDDIEKQLGRDRDSQKSKHGPLALDIDILLWGKAAFPFGSKPWRVPHHSIVEQAAVAVPLAELAADVIHPTENKTIAEIAAQFEDRSGIRKRDDLHID